MIYKQNNIEKQYNFDNHRRTINNCDNNEKVLDDDKIYNLSLLTAMSTKDWKRLAAEHLLRLQFNERINKEISKMSVYYCTYNYKVE